MKLEHLNIVVYNMEQTLLFYQAAFPHWWVRGEGNADWYGIARRWLHFGDDYGYITFNDSGTGEPRVLQSNEVGLAHLGFVVTNLADLTDRLQAAGFTVNKESTDHPYRTSVYYIDPNGMEVEFVQYFSDLPTQRNQY